MTDVLLSSDADWVIEDVRAALGDPETTVRVVRSGFEVRDAVAAQTPDLVILDMQIGNMGGVATCRDLRLEAGAGRLPDVKVLMLLDRAADTFLARQSEAEGWLVKPLDAFRLQLAARKVLAGGTMYEDGDTTAEVEIPDTAADDESSDAEETADAEVA